MKRRAMLTDGGVEVELHPFSVVTADIVVDCAVCVLLEIGDCFFASVPLPGKGAPVIGGLMINSQDMND
jgi:hypothetical protein